MLYCTKDDDTNQFLFAALYQSDWSKENSDQSSFTTHESARPGELPDNCTISLVDKKKNWWYQGTQQGTKQELLNSISNANNWSGDNVEFGSKPDTEFQVNRVHKRIIGQAAKLVCFVFALITGLI